MRRLPIAAALASMICGSAAATAQTAVQSAPQAAAPAVHAKRQLIVLDAAAFNPGLVLRQPDPDGSDGQAAELAVLQMIQKARTPERRARAQWDDSHEDLTIFSEALGPGVDLAALPLTRDALETVRNDQSIIANIAKDYFKRSRPFVADPTLDGCDHSKTKPLTSYPSGHATLGYSLGAALVVLFPEKAPAIRARTDDYAYSRMVCGMHYRSDVEASRVLGEWVVTEMLKNPTFHTKFDAARAELKAAGVTR